MANRSDRDPPSLNDVKGDKPTGEMRRGSADPIRASGYSAPHRQAGYKTAICLTVTPKSVLAFQEASIQDIMLRLKLGVFGLLCAMALSACTATRSPIGLQQQVETSLVLVQPSTGDNDGRTRQEYRARAYYTLFPNALNLEQFDRTKEDEVARKCNVSKPAESDLSSIKSYSLGPRFFAMALDRAISFVLGKVEEEIAQTIEDHTATYGATVRTTAFYRAKPSIQTNFSCFRFTRGKMNKTPNMEVIGHMELAPDTGALIIRPLRVYFGKQAAKRGSKFGVAVGFKANATWQKNGVGKQSDSFDVPFFAAKIDMDDITGKRVWYSVDDDGGDDRDRRGLLSPKSILVPAPSWTTPPSTSTFGNVSLSVSVAEVGKHEYLKSMRSLIANNKDEIKDVLKEAASKVLPDDA